MGRLLRLLGEAQRSARDWRASALKWEEGARKYQGMFDRERQERIWALNLAIQLLEEVEMQYGQDTSEQRTGLTAMVAALTQRPTG
jgi:hypothetical protein